MIDNAPALLIGWRKNLMVAAPCVKRKNFFLRPCINAGHISFRRHSHNGRHAQRGWGVGFVWRPWLTWPWVRNDAPALKELGAGV